MEKVHSMYCPTCENYTYHGLKCPHFKSKHNKTSIAKRVYQSDTHKVTIHIDAGTLHYNMYRRSGDLWFLSNGWSRYITRTTKPIRHALHLVDDLRLDGLRRVV